MITSPNGQRPEIPRSTSYLTRHRRTPSLKTQQVVNNTHESELTPPSTAEGDAVSSLHASASLRKSPPPITDASQMPSGAVLSPPESVQNSSDEEEEKERGRQMQKLAELQAAIRTIGQHRESSPIETPERAKNSDRLKERSLLIGPALTLDMPKCVVAQAQEVVEKATCLLSPNARKISHTRSNTDSSLFDVRRRKGDSPLSDSEDETDSSESDSRKPPMLRKKSGELVRPALRPSSRRRPSSMPGTPTFSKAVHFDSHLEHVRHFLQVDRPLAVSAGSSPVESHQSDTEFPFSDEDSSSQGRSPPYEWEIIVANFPPETYERLQLPVRVERVFLSTDNKTLIGSIAAANLAFSKTVIARFTLDYWKTTSEVVAEYTNDVRRKKLNDGYDRFNFTIKLADLANLEAKTMFFCVKYAVNGVEYWDNNNGTNFQVDFRKNMKPINGKRGYIGASNRQANGLPRSSKKSPTTARPPVPTFDDFTDGFEEDRAFQYPYAKNNHEFLEGAGRIKGVRSEVNLDRFKKKAPNPHGQAFSNRYDFSASLNAAIQAANSTLGDRSGITIKSPSPKKSPTSVPAAPAPKAEPAPPASVTSNNLKPALTNVRISGADSPQRVGTEQPHLASQSYNELLDKYCFVRQRPLPRPPFETNTLF